MESDAASSSRLGGGSVCCSHVVSCTFERGLALCAAQPQINQYALQQLAGCGRKHAMGCVTSGRRRQPDSAWRSVQSRMGKTVSAAPAAAVKSETATRRAETSAVHRRCGHAARPQCPVQKWMDRATWPHSKTCGRARLGWRTRVRAAFARQVPHSALPLGCCS